MSSAKWQGKGFSGIQKSHELEKDLFPCPDWDALGCEKPSAKMLVVAYLTLPLPGLNSGLLPSVLTDVTLP